MRACADRCRGLTILANLEAMMSREWQIDCEVKELIGRFVQETITEAERAKLRDLQRERVERMLPQPFRAGQR